MLQAPKKLHKIQIFCQVWNDLCAKRRIANARAPYRSAGADRLQQLDQDRDGAQQDQHAAAVGIVSGWAATGLNQSVKQLSDK